MSPPQSSESFFTSGLKPNQSVRVVRWLYRVEIAAILAGVAAVLVHAGFARGATSQHYEIQTVERISMAVCGLCRLLRFFLTPKLSTLSPAISRSKLIVPVLWFCGVAATRLSSLEPTATVANLWTPLAVVVVAVLGLLAFCRNLAAITKNSAVLLVGSFLVVIAVGTVLLKLPACRAVAADGSIQEPAGWDTALFTATSASCVTGLIVEPTGSYWSPLGHAVIFSLFQIGGLGILTFGAFVAVLSGRFGLQFREARTLREMLDSDSVQSSRRLLLTIMLFTLVVEGIGAMSMMGLWPHLPVREQAWNAVFHSVSAFCNAGFSLQDDGFLGMGGRWQIYGVVSTLIILGGLGFPVVQNVWICCWGRVKGRPSTILSGRPVIAPPLSLHTRIVLTSTASLLLFGAVSWYILESFHATNVSATQRAADAWFQSVTFRTAGFNSVDHASMHPANKLLAIFLMFIGAAPGSTGGGVKTVVFSVTLINIWTVLRGRDRAEVFGRSIPARQVSRSLAIVGVGIFVVMATTGLLVIFEQKPDRFLDHLFEATSAFGTVGVSAGITPELSLPSRLLICAVMFLGRVGPITLLLAMANPADSPRYDYPEERLSLG